MCSIFGFIPSAEGALTIDAGELARGMAAQLSRRGPDDTGWEILRADGTWMDQDHYAGASWNLMMGQNRLAIIDLTKNGHQPMRSDDGRFTLVLNGEIYNYRELRRVLEAGGRRFRSRSDTEVFLQSFAEWGWGCLGRVVGMYAFALHDAKSGVLHCARDPFGIKPFFYHAGPDGFCYASEIGGLMRLPRLKPRIDAQRALDYLCHLSVDDQERTMLEGVRQLLPGQRMDVSVDGALPSDPVRYWSIELREPARKSFSAAVEELRTTFVDSVRMHLVSDVPVAVCLSGGVDSSAIACAMRHLEPDMDIHTFSYIPADDPGLSEEEWIDLVNAEVRAIPHKERVASSELVPDLDDLVSRLGEPFGGTSIYAQYRVFKSIHAHGIKVALEGQGGDELLGGYFGYPVENALSLLDSGHPLRALRFMRNTSAWPGRDGVSIRKRVNSELKARLIGRKRTGRVPGWLRSDFILGQGLNLDKPPIESLYRSRSLLRDTLASAATQRGLPTLLRHGDRNSMSWSVESRVPFCTKAIADLTLNLPTEYLIGDDGTTKKIFKAAMRGIVPDAILDRRDKVGFKTPEKAWMADLQPWVQKTLEESAGSRLLDTRRIAEQWRAVLGGIEPYRVSMWRAFNYLRWKDAIGASE